MKQTMPIWAGLTLLMLLLVLISAFIFLFQELSEQRTANVDLQATIGTLEGSQAGASSSLLDLSEQLTQQAGPLADYAATQTAVVPTLAVADELTPTLESTPTLSETVVVTQTEVVSESAVLSPTVELSATIELSSTLESAVEPEETIAVEPTPFVPEIEIVEPEDGTVLQLGDVITVTAKISDLRGLERVWLLENDVEVRTLAADNATTFEYSPQWTAVEPGRFELVVGAKNLEGREHSTQGVVVFVEENVDADTKNVTGEGG